MENKQIFLSYEVIFLIKICVLALISFINMNEKMKRTPLEVFVAILLLIAFHLSTAKWPDSSGFQRSGRTIGDTQVCHQDTW